MIINETFSIVSKNQKCFKMFTILTFRPTIQKQIKFFQIHDRFNSGMLRFFVLIINVSYRSYRTARRNVVKLGTRLAFRNTECKTKHIKCKKYQWIMYMYVYLPNTLNDCSQIWAHGLNNFSQSNILEQGIYGFPYKRIKNVFRCSNILLANVHY